MSNTDIESNNPSSENRFGDSFKRFTYNGNIIFCANEQDLQKFQSIVDACLTDMDEKFDPNGSFVKLHSIDPDIAITDLRGARSVSLIHLKKGERLVLKSVRTPPRHPSITKRMISEKGGENSIEKLKKIMTDDELKIYIENTQSLYKAASSINNQITCYLKMVEIFQDDDVIVEPLLAMIVNKKGQKFVIYEYLDLGERVDLDGEIQTYIEEKLAKGGLRIADPQCYKVSGSDKVAIIDLENAHQITSSRFDGYY